MDSKARYILPLYEDGLSDEAVSAVAAQLAADPTLSENARRRGGSVKLERWWNIVAGILLVLFMVLYSFYLTIPALIVLALMVGFMLYAGLTLMARRRVIRNTDPEISPHRAADTFLRAALGLRVRGRDVTYLMDADRIAAFSAALMIQLRELGVNISDMTLHTEVQVTSLERQSAQRSVIPVVATIISGDVEVILEYSATFALSVTGDCMIADVCPRILRPVRLYATPAELRRAGMEFTACPACGARISKRCLKAAENVCPACGANTEPEA